MGGVRCRYSLLGNKLARFLSAAVAVRTPLSVFVVRWHGAL